MSALIVGLLMVKVYPSKILNPKRVSPAAQVLPETQKQGPPITISIPAINLNIPVAPGIIKNNEWTLYDDKAAWLSTSKTPGNGNVIIYAHNWASLFGSLYKVQIGQEIKISTNGKEYTYIISEKRKVLPTDIDAVISDRDQLTLYTCDGSFDQKRLIVIALPKP